MLEVAKTIASDATQPRLQAVVTGIRSAQVIEFTFIYGDPDLAVELVLPPDAFREFCATNACRVTASDDQLRAAVRHLIGPAAALSLVSIGETEPHA